MGFFKRVKTAIVNFEKYKVFADENVSKAMGYFFKIVIMFVIFATLAVSYPISSTVINSVEYLRSDVPDFSIAEGKLTVDSDEPVIITNDEMSLMLALDASINSENVNSFFEENKKYENVLLFIEDKLYLKLSNTSGIMVYDYNTLTQTLSTDNISRQQILEYFDNTGYAQLFIRIYAVLFIYLLLSYIISTLLDIVIISVLALLSSKIYKVGLNYKQCFNMSIYALTLPIILNIVYVLLNSFTGFTIQYFQIMYNLISYIYIIAAILIIKSDFNKTASDMIKVEEEVKDINKEELPAEEPKEEKQDKDKDEEQKDKKNKKDNKKSDDDMLEPGAGNA